MIRKLLLCDKNAVASKTPNKELGPCFSSYLIPYTNELNALLEAVFFNNQQNIVNMALKFVLITTFAVILGLIGNQVSTNYLTIESHFCLTLFERHSRAPK